uniref:IS3 family transposase n=1 Tax=Paenibacillus profundus TaxID=1173085 RepID=UPI0038990AD7
MGFPRATQPCIESFHSVLKKELVYLEKFKTRSQAKKSIFEYISCFYNGKRIHSSIEYYTPNQYERMHLKLRNSLGFMCPIY